MPLVLVTGVHFVVTFVCDILQHIYASCVDLVSSCAHT